VSAAKPKIANYAFTTLVPNLGMVYYRDDRSFVMADIPGIIEGANEGKGLGFRFLRHIERNAVLLFVISAESENIKAEYEILLKELQTYNPQLVNKSRILGISKSDVIDEELQEMLMADLPSDLKTVFFSSLTGKGVQELKDELWKLMGDSYGINS